VAYAVGGSHPEGVAVGDLNADGYLDVVTANAGSNDVSVLLGNGHGQLGSPLTRPVGTSPRFCAIGDLNGDGLPDVAVTNALSASVSVLLGDSAALLGPSISFAIGASGHWVTIVDLDNDGRPDLVTANYQSNTLSILPNQLGIPASIASFGTGTHGCFGILGVGTNGPPKVNSPTFGFTCAHAPRSALGLGIVTNAQDAGGSDPFGIGVKLHVDLFAATQVYSFDFHSDVSGAGFAKAPIPNSPFLAGTVYYEQSLWVESLGYQCGPSPFHLVTSKGLAITIQP
jgi:hypothetical protein